MKGFRKKLTIPALYLAVGLAVFGVAYTLMGQEGGDGTTPAQPEQLARTLFDVLAGGDVQELQQFLDDGADPNQKNADGVTLLGWAILGMETTPTVYSQVKALIAAGANPNIADNGGKTALHYAAQYGGSNAVTQALIDAGVGPDIKSQEGVSALQLAALSGNAGIIASIACGSYIATKVYECENRTRNEYQRDKGPCIAWDTTGRCRR